MLVRRITLARLMSMEAAAGCTKVLSLFIENEFTARPVIGHSKCALLWKVFPYLNFHASVISHD